MFWDSTYYGGHTGNAVDAPAHAVAVRRGQPGLLRHVRAAGQRQRDGGDGDGDVPRGRGANVVHVVPVPPTSRVNVYAGAIPELIGKSFSIVVTSTLPIIAERAMYFGTRLFEGGHESAGVSAGLHPVVPRRGRDRRVLRHLHPRRQSQSHRGQPDGDVPQGRRHDAGAQQAGAGQRPLHDARGRRGSVARQHGGVDDGGVRHPGGIGTRHVLAGRFEHLVRGAQQLRRHDHGDAVGAGGGTRRPGSRNSRPTC